MATGILIGLGLAVLADAIGLGGLYLLGGRYREAVRVLLGWGAA